MTLPTVDFEKAVLVLEAPGNGPGFWTGAPSAVLDDGTYYLAYRKRRPVTDGRGGDTVVATSTDGVHFETVYVANKEMFSAASLERPAIVRKLDGTWQLYVSCATPESKHWWIEVLEADAVSGFETASRRVAFAGNKARVGVKDPVVHWRNDTACAYLTCHPLDVPGAEDRMYTTLATSTDTVTWTDHGEVLSPRPGTWDARGARVSDVIFAEGDTPSYMFYDGRPTMEDNAEEFLGLAQTVGVNRFEAVGHEPVAVSPFGSQSLRYLSIVALPDGSSRLYYEACRADGAHDLYTQLA